MEYFDRENALSNLNVNKQVTVFKDKIINISKKVTRSPQMRKFVPR